MAKRLYVRIKFRPAGKKARWYWAIKLRDNLFVRCDKEGDEWSDGGKTSEGVEIDRKELLYGKPLEECPARMNLTYGWLEVVEESEDK